MKIEKFERKDGSEGQNYVLEEGDEVIARFDTPKTTQTGQYANNSLGVTWNNKEIFLKLTNPNIIQWLINRITQTGIKIILKVTR